MRHLLSLKDLSSKDLKIIIKTAERIKKKPAKYEDKLRRESLLMMFSKPSLRTHLSFDVAMYKLGGHPIFYDLSRSTLGKKESIKDFSKVVSRYADVIMARLFSHSDLVSLAEHSDIPVINGLTDYFHPCQILGDLLTMKEQFGHLEGRRVCFIGDANNNVAHSLIEGCNLLGVQIVICCPKKKEYLPNPDAIGNDKYEYERTPSKAIKEADIIYADSWMSYHIPKAKEKKRLRDLKPYKVDEALFNKNSRVKFMHCLPATRGIEVSDGVMDSQRSIIYDQAENRMHIEKAILLWATGKV